MIEINLNTARFKLTVKGHAQPEEHSEYQAICSGVSAIVQGMVYCIGKYDEEWGALKALEYRPEPGDVMVRPWPLTFAESAMRHKMNNFGDALELMAMAHPEAIHMIRDGEEIQPEEKTGGSKT